MGKINIMTTSLLNLTRVDQFASDNVSTNNQGTIGRAVAGQVTNIDLAITDDSFIIGNVLRTSNAKFGDYIDFQIIDIDNVLGNGINAVLNQYITSWYLRDDAQEQINENMLCPIKIPAGVYLRVIYHSTGISDVTVTINYRLHKALY